MGEAIGGGLQAVSNTLEIPLKVSAEIREWKKYQHDLSQGGVEDAFTPIVNLVPGLDDIRQAIRTAYDAPEDQFRIIVDWNEPVRDSHLIPFRAAKTKNKLALRLTWDTFSAHVVVRAAADVTLGKDSFKKGALIRENKAFGAFVNNIAVDVYGHTHIKEGGYNFDIGGGVRPSITSMNTTPVSVADVTLKLSTSISNKKVHGQGNNPKTFKYVIKGDHTVASSFAAQGAAVEVPGVRLDENGALPKGQTFTAKELAALHAQAAQANQAKLFGLDKDGSSIPVWVSKPPDGVQVPLFLVIGDDHAEVLRAYMSDPTRVNPVTKGTIRYHKTRRHPHGEWIFTNLTDFEKEVSTEVRRIFRKDYAAKTGKTLTFE